MQHPSHFTGQNAPFQYEDVMGHMPIAQGNQNYSPLQQMSMPAQRGFPPQPHNMIPHEVPYEFPVMSQPVSQQPVGHRRLVSHQIKTASSNQGIRLADQGVLRSVSTNSFSRMPHSKSLAKHEYVQTWNLDLEVHFVEYNPRTKGTLNTIIFDKKQRARPSSRSFQIEGPASKENMKMRTGVIKLGQFLEYQPESSRKKAKHARS